MTAIVLRGDARHLPLPDDSVDLVISSPPYWGLRSYTDAGEHYSGQIGSEPTPAAYIAALVDCTREWVRVLKPSGSMWVNLGDKYSGAQQQNTGPAVTAHASSISSAEHYRRMHPRNTGIPNKSLMGLPWRYALACTDQLGLILRAEVIWSKPHGLPESVTDRVRRSHETWFHLTRMPRYYSAVDEIREQHQTSYATQSWAERRANGAPVRYGEQSIPVPVGHNPLGKLPGSVWTIPSQPLTVPPALGVDHFAAFPMELPRRIIQGWSPPGICTVCGEGRRPVGVSAITADRGGRQFNPASGNVGVLGKERVYRLTGYACACTDLPGPVSRAPMALRETRSGELPPTRPAVVLDPFGGTGTTALLADVLGRTGISVDRSADYSRLARWRTTDPSQRAAAMQVDKPPPVMQGQDALFP